MDWSRGYTARYYMSIVNPNTMRDTEKFEITGGTVKYESSGLRTSADVSCVNYSETAERLVRVWLNTTQENESSGHTPLFTGYTSSPDRNINGNQETQTVQCYSVLLPASDMYLERGWYAPVDIDALSVIRSLLYVCNVPIEAADDDDSTRVLKNAIVAERGETHLTMVDKILEAINWRLWIEGDGTIHIEPYTNTPVKTFGASYYDIIEPTLTVSYNWFECPNCVRVFLDDDFAIAKDEDSDTPISIQNRGREVWYEDDNVSLNKGETLQEYAFRCLEEQQRVATTINYDRRFDPDVHLLDVIALNYPRQNIIGSYLITSQTINLGYSAKTSEEVIAV